MSDLEFIGKVNPQPFKSLATIEKERLEEVRQRIHRDKLKAMGNLPPEPEPQHTREPSVEWGVAMFLQMHLHPPLHPDSLLLLSFTKTSLLAQSFNSI